MNDVQFVKFAFARIITDEFAILSEEYDPQQQASMNVAMAFGFNPFERAFGIQVKCFVLVQNKPIAVIAVTCQFQIAPEDWTALYAEKTNTLAVPKAIALHFASLAVSTTRGVLHAKTERHPINVLIIPPIDVSDFIKSELVLNSSQMTPEQAPHTVRV
ncbi:MAG TPA: hypothetical protein VGS79_03445 [Puia sp.]|nr:hypothetical protein [Puia sp.]